MKLNFDFEMRGIDGELFSPPQTVAKTLAGHIISAGKTPDELKFYEWAKKLYSDGVLELDKSDVDKLKKFVEASGATRDECQTMNNLTRGHILEYIRSVEVNDR